MSSVDPRWGPPDPGQFSPDPGQGGSPILGVPPFVSPIPDGPPPGHPEYAASIAGLPPGWVANPGSPGATPTALPLPTHTPFRAAYVFAILGPLILIALLAAPLGIATVLRDRGLVGNPGGGTGTSTGGGPGLGDPYYPNAGNTGYDVARYQLSLDWNTTTATLSGTTTISARSLQSLTAFYYDLALDTETVSVNGATASFQQTDHSDVRVVPAQPIPAESDFTVVVTYSGKPGTISQGDLHPWLTDGEEWTVSGEPEAAAWWFPSNDHPSDPALMDISVRVPAGFQVISIGRLESKDTANEADHDTWHWVSRQPSATYLTFLGIGHYQIEDGVADGRPYLYAVSMQLPADQRTKILGQLEKSVAIVRVLEQLFGPYPFTELGGFAPVHRLWFGGLECQTRPVYNARSLLDDKFAPTLIAHELAHMWFGDNVTVKQWNDIFDNEAWASWAQWGYAERTGGAKANDSLNGTYEQTAGDVKFWRVTMIDPGKANLFENVYTRGPMVLQALRNVMGDEAFFRFARDWSQHPGSRSLEDWMAAAQTETTTNLGPFFHTWIYAPTAPARTAENGFR